MRAALAAYQRALAGRDHLICYAMKANSSLAVLQLFAAAGCGFDIVSGGELERVLAAGGDPAQVVFSGVGKTRAEMRQRARGRRRAASTSRAKRELEVLVEVAAAAGRAAPRQPARQSRRRCQDPSLHLDRPAAATSSASPTSAPSQPTGARRSLPGIEVVGIDCHIGSQITEIAPVPRRARPPARPGRGASRRDGIALHHIDLGGGLGITYTDEQPPAADALMRRAARAHRRARPRPSQAPVRTGPLAGRQRRACWSPKCCTSSPASSKNFCIVDAAMNDLMRPAMYERLDGHRASARARERRAADATTWSARSANPATGSAATARSPSRPGDLLAVLSAGAYGMSMASNYNTRGRAAEVMVSAATQAMADPRAREHRSSRLIRGERPAVRDFVGVRARSRARLAPV